jgi:microsomal dipeptidase-like Zn-dependent dipeptidase
VLRIFSIGLVLLAGLALCYFALGPAAVERRVQGVEPGHTEPPSELAHEIHSQLTIVDWHSDSLLWKRDLLRRSERGHVDIPRLREGNVAVQMFTAVTKSPLGQNYDSNEATFDLNTFMAVSQLWPTATWNSRIERALYQARKLEKFSKASRGQLSIALTSDDLAEALLRRAEGEPIIAALLGIEGAHALDGELENLDRLFDAGFRMVGLQHFFDNRLGGSLHGVEKGGLTDFGREVVRSLEARQMIIDLAHSSPRVVDEVLAMATRPVVISHTGVYGACPSARNISDEQMKKIAAGGGLIAIGYWDGAICDISPQGVVRAIRYAIDLVGAEHVALGSDFDGGTTTAFDTAGLSVLTQAMLDAEFSPLEIEQVMGMNSVRFLLRQLPRRRIEIAAGGAVPSAR